MKRLLEHLELQFPLDSAGLLYTFSLGSTLGWISCGPQWVPLGSKNYYEYHDRKSLLLEDHTQIWEKMKRSPKGRLEGSHKNH